MAFKLIPQGGPTLLAKPYSLIAKRGLFATKHLWVTPHKEEERYAAGDWVLQAEGGAGLEEWTKQVFQIYTALLRTDATPPPPHPPHPLLISNFDSPTLSGTPLKWTPSKPTPLDLLLAPPHDSSHSTKKQRLSLCSLRLALHANICITAGCWRTCHVTANCGGMGLSVHR